MLNLSIDREKVRVKCRGYSEQSGSLEICQPNETWRSLSSLALALTFLVRDLSSFEQLWTSLNLGLLWLTSALRSTSSLELTLCKVETRERLAFAAAAMTASNLQSQDPSTAQQPLKATQQRAVSCSSESRRGKSPIVSAALRSEKEGRIKHAEASLAHVGRPRRSRGADAVCTMLHELSQAASLETARDQHLLRSQSTKEDRAVLHLREPESVVEDQ